MHNLLFVAHTPGTNTAALRDAVARGARHPDLPALDLHVRAPLAATPGDVLRADGLLLGATENFGSMAGLVKDFFERIYYPCLEQKQGMPFAFYVRAGNDGTGASAGIERIVTGLRWRMVQPPLLLVGEFQPAFVAQCEELGQTMAAGLAAGVY